MMRSGKLLRKLIPVEGKILKEVEILTEVDIHASVDLGRVIDTVRQTEIYLRFSLTY